MLIPYKYMYIVGLSWFVLSRSTSYCPEWYHITVWYYPAYTELLPCIVCNKHLWNASSFKFLQVPSSSFKFLQVPSSFFKFLQVPSSSFKFLQVPSACGWSKLRGHEYTLKLACWGSTSLPSLYSLVPRPHYLPSSCWMWGVLCGWFLCVCLCMCMRQGSRQAFSRWFWTIWMCQI